MTRKKITAAALTIAFLAQGAAVCAQQAPAAELAGKDAAQGTFPGYVASRGDGNGGAIVLDKDGNQLPPISNGTELSADRVEGFNKALEENFPMTPDMVRRYRDVFEANQRALLEREVPKARVEAGFISLEPGEAPPRITVAPGIASVIGFYDVTGQPWPITQHVLGAEEDFQVIQLGGDSNNIAVTPLKRVGFSNVVVMLKDQPKPVVMRIEVSNAEAQDRYDLQILSAGPNANANTAAEALSVREAGSRTLLSVLSGVDIPTGSKPVSVQGVDARGWVIGENLFLRSKHALLSPQWLSSMSGPDGIRVYEIPKSNAALFSVDGTIVRADVVLP